MQNSKKTVNATITHQIEEMFFQVMVDSTSNSDVKTILADLLTEAELQALVKRLAVAVFLDKGRSYENIKHYLKVSSATIATVAEHMGNPGIQMALNKIKAEKWADDWTARLSAMVRRIMPKS